MSENLCPICLSVIEENENTYKLECNHFFHDKCIINWFRAENSNGKCPCCNDTPQSDTLPPLNNTYYYDNNLIEQRCSAIRRYGNKKSAPKLLKAKVEKLKKLENQLKDINKEKKEFTDENKEIFKEKKKLFDSMWKKKYQIRKQKYNMICSFANMTIPENIIFL